MSKATIKSGEIDTDDCIRLAFEGQMIKSVKQSAKFEIMFDCVGQADHRVLRHVESQIDSCRRHTRATSAEKARLEAGMKRLIIPGGDRFRAAQLITQCVYELGRQQISAGLAGDEHERLRLHIAYAEEVSICFVISNARSSARFADSPLTSGSRWARTHSIKSCNSSLSGSSLAIGTGSRTIRLPPNSLTMIESLARSIFFNKELSSSPSLATR